MKSNVQFRISGADKNTGEDLELIVEAPDEVTARQKASARGVLVASCSALPRPTTNVETPGTIIPTGKSTKRKSAQNRTLMLVAIGIFVGLAVVGGIVFVVVRGSANPAAVSLRSELVAALGQFRTALFKMRADLKLGQSDQEYLVNMRSLQLASDQVTDIATAAERGTPLCKGLQQVFDEYLAAYKCIENAEKVRTMPDYPNNIARVQADYDTLAEEVNADPWISKCLKDGDKNDDSEYRKELQLLNNEQQKKLQEYLISTIELRHQKATKQKYDDVIAKIDAEKQQHWINADQLLSSLNPASNSAARQ